jgi:hypothetical protein
MIQDQRLYDRVLKEIQDWVPSQAYDHESKFQKELQDVLDARLNDSGGGQMGQNKEIPVHRERGRSNADLAVDDVVGVEMKRNLTNSQAKKLRGQIEAYLDSYNFVIIVACGIQDTSNWREMKNKYEGRVTVDSGYIKFIWKKKENYATNTKTSQQEEPESPKDAGSNSSTIPENPALGDPNINEPDIIDPDINEPDINDPFK